MVKPLKKLYFPSGLIASMYNLYGGDGGQNSCLSEYDVQLLTAYMEFYMNYTHINQKKNVYWFYTLPQFYNAKANDMVDLEAEADNDEIKKGYITKVSSKSGEFLGLAEKLTKLKQQQIWAALRKGMKKELDPEFDKKNDPSIDYEKLARNSYEYGIKIFKKDFRTPELYSRKRKSEADSSREFFVFIQREREDRSTFFILKPSGARKNMSPEEFRLKDVEMQQHIENYFRSDSYKVFANDKREKFAPDSRLVVDCFKKAVKAYNQLGLSSVNKYAYSKVGAANDKASSSFVENEMVDE